MTDPLQTSFDSIAKKYDAQRRNLIPCYDDFYGMATELATRGSPSPRVLDVGAGTGLMTQHILEKRPEAVCTLVDFAEEMLKIARQRFSGLANVQYVSGDYRNADLGSGYDVIVSALSIHHLDDPGKARLYRRLYGLLSDGGVFVNADQVLGATPGIEADYQRQWREKILASGLSGVEKAAVFERMKMDRPATLADNLQWLRDAGFRDVDVYYKYYNFAVISGRR